ncbi:hypothetical protein IQ264_17630 [Phormidium sp. LEGE 05292]|uniref:hypothetical protein n=1 Tax=[Phormidium] sp. LEGE 05292 TaxID=767427 RepID=UPI0018806BA3|nr:hypothetical protein [Phormidium sp. LEGE 05292]MBE9227250.1 hypothetical protein [Phormidium sp. LEGE 05292]
MTQCFQKFLYNSIGFGAAFGSIGIFNDRNAVSLENAIAIASPSDIALPKSCFIWLE